MRRDAPGPLERLLVTASVMAFVSIGLMALLAWQLADIRAQTAAARRDCRCCAPDGVRP
jgi:hypothetical protein